MATTTNAEAPLFQRTGGPILERSLYGRTSKLALAADAVLLGIDTQVDLYSQELKIYVIGSSERVSQSKKTGRFYIPILSGPPRQIAALYSQFADVCPGTVSKLTLELRPDASGGITHVVRPDSFQITSVATVRQSDGLAISKDTRAASGDAGVTETAPAKPR